MNAVDPSGHFSKEQLGELGIAQDQVSKEMWEMLLLLEPDDLVYDAYGGIVGQVAVGYAATQQGFASQQLALFLMTPGGLQSAVSGLSGYTSNSIVIYREFNGEGVENDLDGPLYASNGSSYYEVWRLGTQSSLMKKRSGQTSTRVTARQAELSNITSNAGINYGSDACPECPGLFIDLLVDAFNYWTGDGYPDPGAMTDDLVFTFDYSLGDGDSLSRKYVYRNGRTPPLISHSTCSHGPSFAYTLYPGTFAASGFCS
ncbi:MAG: hypothetical protein U0175_34585 [Caldilineaceae bacterium]